MNGGTGPSRLSRLGIVRESIAGCTSVDASVPCSSCRLGCGAARSGTHLLVLPSATVSGDPRPGDGVRISVDAAGLAKSSLLLFGPVLAWALCAATLPAVSTAVGTPAWVDAAAIGAGLAVCLLLGRRLVRGSPDRTRRLLDVRAEPGVRAGAIES